MNQMKFKLSDSLFAQASSKLLARTLAMCSKNPMVVFFVAIFENIE